MRIGKRKQLVQSPAQIEQLGRMSPADIAASYHPDSAEADILRQFDQAALLKLQAAEGITPRGGSAKRSDHGADAPPLTNRGEKGSEESNESEMVRLVIEDGVVKEVPKRRGYGGDSAFIDWVNFTIGEETIVNQAGPAKRIGMVDGEIDEFYDGPQQTPVTDMEVMVAMSHRLHNIFGFGISQKRSNGANFYRDSWDIGDNWGMVCHGGQRGTILVMLNGSGCAAAKPGWELRLKTFLEQADRSRLTRVDFAHDDFNGETYSVDSADQDHTDGLFHLHGRHPECEHRGNWKHPNGKGRTLNIGNRKNGKFCRVYEKGRQLGDKNSAWVRIEVEFKAVDRVIPFDCLLVPGEYLAASYPAFSWISEQQHRILTTQKVVQASLTKALAWMRHQCGASIDKMCEVIGKDEFFKEVVRDGNPAWFKVPHFGLAPESIHQAKVERYSVVLSEQAAAWA